MKICLIVLSCGVLSLHAALRRDDDDGRYQIQNDDSGQYRPTAEGRYVPDFSGSYIPDPSGIYQHDDSGSYRDDGSGKYIHRQNIYKQSPFRDGGGFARQSTFRGDFNRPRLVPFAPRTGSTIYRKSGVVSTASIPPFSPNLVEVGAFDASSDVVTASSTVDNRSNFKSLADNFGQANFNTRSGGNFGNVAAAATHSTVRHGGAPASFGATGSRRYPATGQYRGGDDSRWRILKQDSELGENGYRWDYETENGIIAAETGQIANKGSDKEGLRAQGSYSYTGPDNVVYAVTYTADENGFQAQGAHLPTPPPTPEAILKSLEFQRAAGKL